MTRVHPAGVFSVFANPDRIEQIRIIKSPELRSGGIDAVAVVADAPYEVADEAIYAILAVSYRG